MSVRGRGRFPFLALRRVASGLSWAMVLAATVLSLSSYRAYTTAGFDFETPTETGVDVHYYRLRWDDGSTWVGLAVQACPRPNRRLDWFDPGGTWLASPTRPDHRTWARSLGFWRVGGSEDDPYVPIRYPGARASDWWACPSWLIILALWHRLLWRMARLINPPAGPPAPEPMDPGSWVGRVAGGERRVEG